MPREGFRLAHVLALACLLVGMGLSGPVAATATDQGDFSAAWSVILDPRQPLAERQHALAKLEKDAQNDGQSELYLLGSLYHMGPHASGAPVP